MVSSGEKLLSSCWEKASPFLWDDVRAAAPGKAPHGHRASPQEVAATSKEEHPQARPHGTRACPCPQSHPKRADHPYEPGDQEQV